MEDAIAMEDNFLSVCEHCQPNPGPDKELLAGVLPTNYEHQICQFTPNQENSTQFEVKLRLKLNSEDDANKWLQDFQKASYTTFRLARTYPKIAEKFNKLEYKVELRCQHKTLPRSSTSNERIQNKNTNCPARIQMCIFKSKDSTSNPPHSKKSNDPHLPDRRLMVTLCHNHNHPIMAADALRHRDVSAKVQEKLVGLFKEGFTPAKALDLHKYDLQVEHGDNYVVVMSADRNVCPDLSYSYRLYYKNCSAEYGERKGEKVLQKLEDKVKEYDEATGGKGARMKIVGERNAAIAICTPLMHRVHSSIKHSGELVFIDASGNMDRQGCRVFLLLTHCCAGGVPLGVLVTTSESTETVTEALHLHNSLLSDDSYFGRGQKGPEIFMTDDSLSERQALESVYPESTLLLCIFHVLQAFWRYLWDSKNGVRKEHRPALLSLLKDMVYSETIDNLEENYQKAVNDVVLQSYERVAAHMKDIYERRMLWAVCHRESMNVRGNNTNNYAEASMRILKDQIFERTKCVHCKTTRGKVKLGLFHGASPV